MNEVERRILSSSDPEEQMRLIITHYAPRLYAIIRPIVHTHQNADDVLQETLIKIYQNLKHFKGNSRLYTWLYRIAYNESLQFLRKNKKNFLHVNDTHEEYIKNILQADPWFKGDDAAVLLEKAIENLPPRQAEVFRLKYFSNLKYNEISQMLNLSVGALKAHYHLAVNKIKEYLKNNAG